MKEEKEIKSAPDWLKIKPAEVENTILELGKKGESPAKIGLKLRDEHGVPKAKLITKKISHILRENNLKIKSIKEQYKEKIEKLEKHLSSNKKDNSAKRSLIKKIWVVNKAE